MPLHDFECSTHGLFQKLQAPEELKDFETCPVCEQPARKTFKNFTKGRGGVRVFKPRVFEHIAPEPLMINSREELRQACKKHNCKSIYLEDSFNR